jgi:hypothetical protein
MTNNENTNEPTPQEILKEYQDKFDSAKKTYKECVAQYDDAFDEYDEQCLDEEMASSKAIVKEYKAKMEALKEEFPELTKA